MYEPYWDHRYGAFRRNLHKSHRNAQQRAALNFEQRNFGP
ncbi:hypothetical protein H1R20_g15093, partial [Candolleomyces eurysporus]